jgi:hypothetical protein
MSLINHYIRFDMTRVNYDSTVHMSHVDAQLTWNSHNAPVSFTQNKRKVSVGAGTLSFSCSYFPTVLGGDSQSQSRVTSLMSLHLL